MPGSRCDLALSTLLVAMLVSNVKSSPSWHDWKHTIFNTGTSNAVLSPLAALVAFLKATIHQATFRQFIAYNGFKQRIACKFSSNLQATRCIQYLYPDPKMVVKFCLFAISSVLLVTTLRKRWGNHQNRPENAYKINSWTLYGSLFKYIDQINLPLPLTNGHFDMCSNIMTTWVV